jgi:hypothetical protein
MDRISASEKSELTGDAVAGCEVDQKVEPEPITIACYDNEVPPFVEAEMVRIYESIFSSLAQFRTYGSIAGNTSTYVVRQGSKIVTVFLFVRDGEKVRVLNEVIRISAEDISRFAEYVFAAYKKVTVISFHAIQADFHRLRFPFQKFNCSEDIVLSLPETEQDYLAKLGKHSRKNIKYYLSRLKRQHPTFEFSMLSKDEVTHQQVRDIVILNRHRMAGKDKISAFDDEETDRIINLVKQCGEVGVATVDGKICAGSICLRVGGNYFMIVIAHDSKYDDYRLGTLCCFLTICESMARKGREFHFLWGRYEYKYTLLGIQRDLDHVNVYRSRMQIVLNASTALKSARDGNLRRAKLWLHSSGGQRSIAGRSIIALLGILRKMKHAGERLKTGW